MTRGALLLLLLGCSSVEPSPTLAPPCEARATTLPTDLEAQAWSALERDAWLRDARFREAVEPHRFADTRVDASDVARGRYDAETLYRIGGLLFELRLDRAVGHGAADLPTLSRVHLGARGGPDARHCAACHRRGGPAGSGDAADVAFYDGDGDAPSSGLARDAPALMGAGVLELLARSFSEALVAQRSGAIDEARRRGAPVRALLAVEGISFGVLTAEADGEVDVHEVVGVGPDLVVRPFGRTGRFATLRDVIEDELAVHLGMQTDRLVGTAAIERVGARGGDDPDGDGVAHEITDGQLDALVMYAALAELPTVSVPESSDVALLVARGRVAFTTLGCASCHVPTLPLADATFDLEGRMRVDLAVAGAEPRLGARDAAGNFVVAAYTDLRRHDMGPLLADARDRDGVAASVFMTPPLWGLMRSGPYLHDARAPTVEDAILLHGGEASFARDAYASLTDAERAPLRVFLATLTRARRIEVR